MGREDWYRNTDWSKPTQEAFFRKLSRARSQRDQYLVLQAMTLVPYRPDASLELVDLYFESRKNDFDDARALWTRAGAYVAMGNLSAAVEAYKQVLAREAVFPNFKTRAVLELPYLVATNGLGSEYEFALHTLASSEEDFVFPLDAFEWNAASALIAAAQGRIEDAARMAAVAVQAAETQDSGLQYHQDVGLVGDEDRDVLARLTELVVLVQFPSRA